LWAPLAADDVTSANHALPHTSALHVAVAANVLAPSGPTSDLQELLQLLGLQAEIDAIGAAGHPRRARKLMTGRGHGYRRPRHVLDPGLVAYALLLIFATVAGKPGAA
jgi:hypothetical protein